MKVAKTAKPPKQPKSKTVQVAEASQAAVKDAEDLPDSNHNPDQQTIPVVSYPYMIPASAYSIPASSMSTMSMINTFGHFQPH